MSLRSFASLVTQLLCAAIACSKGGGAGRAVAQAEAGTTTTTGAPPGWRGIVDSYTN